MVMRTTTTPTTRMACAPDFDDAPRVSNCDQCITEKGAVVRPARVNSTGDATCYDRCSYMRQIPDGNALYDAFRRVKSASGWKPAVEKYYLNLLVELADLQQELQSGRFEYPDTTSFILRERGKTRYITADGVEGRLVKSALTEEQLLPSIRPYIIYDSGASVKGRGPAFTRKRFETHIHKFYTQNGSNDGYLLLIDFSKYYDNILHPEFMKRLREYCYDETTLLLVEKILFRARIDVSYMTDEEVEAAYHEVFNSLEYQTIPDDLKTGLKFLCKHVNIGDPVAQIAGICYPIPLDNYIKIVRGIKFYGRYMDDLYIIHKDRDFLEELLKDIIEIANSLGIFINIKKTRIVKLSSTFRFLQIQYSLTDTGRVIKKINPNRITAMRRKLKRLCKIVDLETYDNTFKSWYGNYAPLMSRKQRNNIKKLYYQLREENYSCTLSCLTTEPKLRISNSMATTISRQLAFPIATSTGSSIL